MPLAGDLTGFSLEEIVALLANGGKSGCLVLTHNSAESLLSFDAGMIVDAVQGPLRGMDALSGILAFPSSGQFMFREQPWKGPPSLHINAAEFAALAEQTQNETKELQPVLPQEDERLTIAVPFDRSPALTPLQWQLLAEIPSRCTLRHLLEGRDRLVIERSLVPLLRAGFVLRSGEMVLSRLESCRMVVIWGDAGEENMVKIDQHIIAAWRNTGRFSGKVSVAGKLFEVSPQEGLNNSIVISANVCRSQGIRNAQEVKVMPM